MAFEYGVTDAAASNTTHRSELQCSAFSLGLYLKIRRLYTLCLVHQQPNTAEQHVGRTHTFLYKPTIGIIFYFTASGLPPIFPGFGVRGRMGQVENRSTTT